MSAVGFEVRGPVAEFHLDNPAKLNALTPDMLAELERHCATVEADRAVRAVLVTAAGDGPFCAGADITAWADLSPADFARHWIRNGHRVFDRLARLPVPTVAAVSGHAFGGGLELAAACDIRVMAPNATLALPETGIGVVPGWSGTQRLATQLPPAVIKEMALFGRRIDAQRALALGFAAEITEDPRATALAMAETVASKSPDATEIAKYMIAAALDEDRAAMIDALGSGFVASSEDKTEGVAAFREKRRPRYLPS